MTYTFDFALCEAEWIIITTNFETTHPNLKYIKLIPLSAITDRTMRNRISLIQFVVAQAARRSITPSELPPFKITSQ